MTEATTKKYIVLTDEDARKMDERPIEVNGTTLYRIRALKEFGEIQPGELGGYVEGYDSLSQEGDCWIGKNCKVYEGAKVEMDAVLEGSTELYGGSIATEKAFVSGMVRADSCKFKAHSRIQGKLMLRHVVATGDTLIYGDGCMEYERAEGSTIISVRGFSHTNLRQ